MSVAASPAAAAAAATAAGIDLDALLAVATAAATDAAALIASAAAAPPATYSRKSATDPVTETDLAAEELLRRRLAAAYPDHAFYGEESAAEGGNHFLPAGDATAQPKAAVSGGANAPLGAGPTWIVDPLDGTANFVRRSGGYAVSVGWLYAGWVVAGVVARVDGPVYAARAGSGGGATVDGVASRGVSAVSTAADATVLTEMGSDRSAAKTAMMLDGLRVTLEAGVMAVRAFGSAALNVVAVGDGAAEVYWEWGVWPWDIAGGLVFVREAGGVVGLPDGRPVRGVGGDGGEGDGPRGDLELLSARGVMVSNAALAGVLRFPSFVYDEAGTGRQVGEGM
ncbi:hypothetical protein MMPV_000257 [Pyropia vietnamensis]